jgi:hypothetical protein
MDFGPPKESFAVQLARQGVYAYGRGIRNVILLPLLVLPAMLLMGAVVALLSKFGFSADTIGWCFGGALVGFGVLSWLQMVFPKKR